MAICSGHSVAAGDGHAGAASVQPLPQDAPARHDRRPDRAAQPPPDPGQGAGLVQAGARAWQDLVGAAARHRSLQAGQRHPGPPHGDKVLAEVASCVAAQLRSLDRVGRNGGEEFLVLLPDTSLDEAVEVAERIRHRVAQLRIDGMPEGQPVHVSIGCAQYSPSTRASAIWCSGPTRPCTGPSRRAATR